MNGSKILSLLALAAVMFAGATTAQAHIYMDENFDDGTAFQDQDWLISATADPVSNQIGATQGLNVRSDGGGPKVTVTHTGTVVDTIAFAGNSLRLASGQSVQLGSPTYEFSGGNWWKVFQFAVATDDDTLALPVGTDVGSFKMEFSETADTTIDLTYQINFVRSAGGVDLVVDLNSAVVGTLTAGNQWSVVTVLANRNLGSEEGGSFWEAYDPLTSTYKGPQPIGDPFNGSGEWQRMPAEFGIAVFVNSNNPTNRIAGPDLPSNAFTDIAGDEDQANLVGWQIAADGGNLYIDEMYWSHGLFQDGQGDGFGGDTNTTPNNGTPEGAARLLNFSASPPVNAIRNWTWTH